ncbi:MAG: UDP-N-acetylmuramoyl-L-alanine--D-glutamate ligase [bacterium]
MKDSACLPYKKIAVVGLGLSGKSVANFLSKKGINLIVSDINKDEEIEQSLKRYNSNIEFEWGRHGNKILSAELIVKSPGIPPDMPILKKARLKKIPVVTDIDLAAKYLDSSKVIAVTGTNGKSTVVSMIGHILKQEFPSVIVAGNIGKPVFDILPVAKKETWIVLEVSSYQLEILKEFKAHMSVITNITPDHLYRHKTMNNYIIAKMNIFKNQTASDYALLNFNDPVLKKISKHLKSGIFYFSSRDELKNGIWFKNHRICVNINEKKYSFMPDLKMPGMHNIENALAACGIGELSGMHKNKIIKGINSFPGLEHRLENAGVINGVCFINDSKATNVESTVVALKSFNSDVHLILGGEDKGFPYKPLCDYVVPTVKSIYLIGEASKKIERDLRNTVPIFKCINMEKAVKCAFSRAKYNDIVLLSPACASFDQYKNFEERGEHFKKLIKAL